MSHISKKTKACPDDSNGQSLSQLPARPCEQISQTISRLYMHIGFGTEMGDELSLYCLRAGMPKGSENWPIDLKNMATSNFTRKELDTWAPVIHHTPTTPCCKDTSLSIEELDAQILNDLKCLNQNLLSFESNALLDLYWRVKQLCLPRTIAHVTRQLASDEISPWTYRATEDLFLEVEQTRPYPYLHEEWPLTRKGLPRKTFLRMLSKRGWWKVLRDVIMLVFSTPDITRHERLVKSLDKTHPRNQWPADIQALICHFPSLPVQAKSATSKKQKRQSDENSDYESESDSETEKDTETNSESKSKIETNLDVEPALRPVVLTEDIMQSFTTQQLIQQYDRHLANIGKLHRQAVSRVDVLKQELFADFTFEGVPKPPGFEVVGIKDSWMLILRYDLDRDSDIQRVRTYLLSRYDVHPLNAVQKQSVMNVTFKNAKNVKTDDYTFSKPIFTHSVQWDVQHDRYCDRFAAEIGHKRWTVEIEAEWKRLDPIVRDKLVFFTREELLEFYSHRN